MGVVKRATTDHYVAPSYGYIMFGSFSVLRAAFFLSDPPNQADEAIDICQLCYFGKTAF